MQRGSGKAGDDAAEPLSFGLALEQHVDNTLSLLELEREEEVQLRLDQQSLSSGKLEEMGVRLASLRMGNVETGLVGQIMVTFEAPAWRNDGFLPAHRFSSGDTVAVVPKSGGGANATPDSESSLVRGVVSAVRSKSITVALDHSRDLDAIGGMASLDLLANDVTYQRLVFAMGVVRELATTAAHDAPGMRIARILFDPAVTPSVSKRQSSHCEHMRLVNPNLNPSQVEAVRHCLESEDVSIIHGPPGTGKTTTVIELIQQAVMSGLRVLACAPSNIAVDNMVERLAAWPEPPSDFGMVRVGHTARVMASVMGHSLDAVLRRSDHALVCQGIREDMDKLSKSIAKCRDRNERRSLRSEFKTLRKDLRTREREAVQTVLKGSNVVLCTAAGADHWSLRHVNDFDLVIIDEAAQALEACCWIPIRKGARVVLAGDHQQLPPTVCSPEAERRGLGVTMMDRLMRSPAWAPLLSRMLVTQYRMHERIMGFSSHELYDDRLLAHASVASHVLPQLDAVTDDDVTRQPLMLIDTSGCNMLETQDDAGSKANEGEAQLVVAHVMHLVRAGLSTEDIAVITPYNAQVEVLRDALKPRFPNLEIGSVDGFQGREKEAIVISLVRCNGKRDVGFLRDDRRTNVAITRARRHLCIIGDSLTTSSHPFLERLFAYVERCGDYVSAQAAQACSAATSSSGGGPTKAVLTPEMEAMLMASRQARATQQQEEVAAHTQSKGEAAGKASPAARDTSAGQQGGDGDAVDDETRRAALAARVDAFAKDARMQRYVFAATLSSWERMVVHELAEERGLGHVSRDRVQKGGHRVRFITLYRSPDAAKAAETADATRGRGKGGKGKASTHSRQSDGISVSGSGVVDVDLKHGKAKAAHGEQGHDKGKRDVEQATVSSVTIGSDGCGAGVDGKYSGAGDDGDVDDYAQDDGGDVNGDEDGDDDKDGEGASALEDQLTSYAEQQRRQYQVQRQREQAQAHAKKQRRQQRQAAAKKKGNGKKKKSGGGGKCQRGKQSPKRKAKPVPDSWEALDATASSAQTGKKKEDVEFDALMEKYRNDRCQERDCRKSVKLAGECCRHCNHKYCFAHAQPEVHGCGGRAKAAARAQWKVQGESRILGTKDNTKRLPADKRKVLAHVLQKKLAQKEAARTGRDSSQSRGKGRKKKGGGKKKPPNRRQ